jgi:hypothetical protein
MVNKIAIDSKETYIILKSIKQIKTEVTIVLEGSRKEIVIG